MQKAEKKRRHGEAEKRRFLFTDSPILPIVVFTAYCLLLTAYCLFRTLSKKIQDDS